MKVIILAALVASISAAGWWGGSSSEEDEGFVAHTEYQSGKEYVYKYESQVLTSLPSFTNSHGGIKIVSNRVKIDFKSSQNGVLQMTECQILTLNHEISNPADLPPTKQLPLDRFTPLPSNEASLIKSKLELPIKFKYENGKITSIEVADQETNWSIDVKRSILSMLQIRLQAEKSGSFNPELSFNDLNENNSTVFNFLEPALDGTCYSGVSVRRSFNSSQDNQYRIMKTRDPVNCVRQNSLYKVTWPQMVPNCECDSNLNDKECKCTPVPEEYRNANPAYFDAKTLSEYDVVSSDQEKLLIKRCVQSATYRYEFPNHPDQYLATFSNQTLQLREQKDEQTIQTRSHSFQSVSEPWRHQILKEDEEKPMMTAEQIKKQAKSLIDEMITLSSDPARFEDHLTVFYQLVENLRLSKNDQLEQLFREFDARDNYRKWKVMVDALAHCNTTACDNFLLEKIASGGDSFPLKEATPIFMVWASNKVPTPTVLDKFNKRVIPALEGKSEKTAYYHSLMCFGSMIRRYIHSEEMQKKMSILKDDKLRHQKNIDDCDKYQEVIVNKLNKRDSDEKKIAVLKALANLGSLESLTKLQEMMAKSESTGVRVHAIYAVNNLQFQNRLKVLQTVSPLLMDVSEDSEVRMAAFIFYLACDPSTTQLHRLIEQEPDLDLKTFFVQTLQNIVKSNYDHDRTRVQKAKTVLSKVRAFQMSANSGNFEMKYGLRPETDGDILSWRWLTNQTSPVPRAATIQHQNFIRGYPRHNFEIGYRAEGFDRLFSELTEKYASGRSHPDISILDSIVSSVRNWKKEGTKPQLTLYLRSDGQQIAFIHLDAETINRHMLEAVTRGQMEIPVQMFQTYVAKTEQNKKLQQNGMWHVSERANVGVIDINGTLIIRSPAEGELLPNISFGSEQMFRHEKRTILSQYVRSGFAKTGVTTAMVTRNFIGEQKWNVSYSFQQQNMTFNVTHNNKPILMTNIEAYTNTFVVPMRLPRIVRRKQEAYKDIQTNDPHRVQFDTEIESFKSVQLNAQVQGDVSVPELYTFVRDRLHLLPSILSIKKQHIQITFKPGTSSPRNYTFTQCWKTLQNEIASRPGERPYAPLDDSVERRQKSSWSMAGFFGKFFSPSSSESSSSEEIDYITSENYDPLNELRIGSIRQLWQGRIDSRYHNQVLSMVANLTTQYEHDQPTVHNVLSCERPPIPGKENDRYVFTLVGSREFNPSVNQIVGQHILAWGEKSDPTKSTIKVTEDFRAMYKDNVCYEQSAYGCKDRYGVFYPLQYNHTCVFEQHNTDLVNKTLRFVTPYYMNIGERVWVQPENGTQQWNQNKINVTQIYRPYEAKVDVAYPLDGQHWNISKVYMPVESAWQQMYRVRPMYPQSLYRPVAQYRSGHQQVDPFFSRDSCVYENTRVSSMDFKQLVNPKTDCEVVLLGDCAMNNKQIMVSVKQAITDRTVDKKTLNVILGSSKIEIELVPGTSYSSPSVQIRVNGRQMNLDSNDQLLVNQQKRTVAIIECSDRQCEIKSSPHGLYVKMTEQRVRVEADNGRARYMCGVCSAHPEIRSEQASYQQSVQIFKNSRNQNQQCKIEENLNDARQFLQQQTCNSMHKHKVVSAISGGQLKTCVTTDRVQLCSRHCDQKMIRFDEMPARCVDREEAERLELSPTMEGNEKYLKDERILSKIRSGERRTVQVPVSQDCQ